MCLVFQLRLTVVWCARTPSTFGAILFSRLFEYCSFVLIQRMVASKQQPTTTELVKDGRS
jgi:hypothetical protein